MLQKQTKLTFNYGHFDSYWGLCGKGNGNDGIGTNIKSEIS